MGVFAVNATVLFFFQDGKKYTVFTHSSDFAGKCPKSELCQGKRIKYLSILLTFYENGIENLNVLKFG